LAAEGKVVQMEKCGRIDRNQTLRVQKWEWLAATKRLEVEKI
jgi:hypothetical protein